jgi:hypothetical protein
MRKWATALDRPNEITQRTTEETRRKLAGAGGAPTVDATMEKWAAELARLKECIQRLVEGTRELEAFRVEDAAQTPSAPGTGVTTAVQQPALFLSSFNASDPALAAAAAAAGAAPAALVVSQRPSFPTLPPLRVQ